MTDYICLNCNKEIKGKTKHRRRYCDDKCYKGFRKAVADFGKEVYNNNIIKNKKNYV